MRIHFGPTFQYFRAEEDENRGKFVSNPLLSGVDPANLYDRHFYAGAHFSLEIDTRNNRVLPTRGTILSVNVRPLAV
jgi:outer membrane protein assembly factor BamA